MPYVKGVHVWIPLGQLREKVVNIITHLYLTNSHANRANNYRDCVGHTAVKTLHHHNIKRID